MARDGIEYVLLAGAEDQVRAHAGRGLGHPCGDGLGVPLAATFRLRAGHVPLPVVLRGRPARMGIGLRVDLEPPRGMLITGRVGDDGGAVTLGQHDHVGRAPRRERGQLPQVRQRPDLDRSCSGPVWQPPREQHLTVRRDHHPGTARDRIPGAGGQRPGGPLVGTERASLPRGIGPGHVPGVRRFGL